MTQTHFLSDAWRRKLTTMPVYVISGKCNCPKLAHCELAAGRLMLQYPNVIVQFELRDPEECKTHFLRIKDKFGFTGKHVKMP